jgi:superfamily II DNA/RNA helicase
VPFIHGGTARTLEKVQESDVCVVSRIGDRGISLPDLRLVVEVAGAGSAREQFAQRVGRLLHGEFEGEFVTVFTPEEAAKYRGRIFGVEAELAGEVDIEFVTVGEVKEAVIRVREVGGSNRTRVAQKPASVSKETDEIAHILSTPAVAAKITQAKKLVGERTEPYVERVVRYCWNAALSAKEISEGLGIVDNATRSRMSSACGAAFKVGLLVVDDQKRYKVDAEEIRRLKVLSGLRRTL